MYEHKPARQPFPDEEISLCNVEIGKRTPFILVEIAGKQYLRTCQEGHLLAFHKLGEELERHNKSAKDWTALETGWLSITDDGVSILSGSGAIDPPEYQNVAATKAFIAQHLKDLRILDD